MALGVSFKLQYLLDPSAAVRDVGEEAAEWVAGTEAFQKYACPLLKSEYADTAKQDAEKNPDARAQAAAQAATYFESLCTEPLPSRSAEYPSGVPAPGPAVDPTILFRQVRYAEPKPFYKRPQFWLGLGVLGAASYGAFYLTR